LKQVYDQATGKPIEGLFMDRNRDGIINDNDFYHFFNPDPKVFMGVNSDVNYKKLSAGFSMRSNIGNYVYNNIASSSGTVRNIINPLSYLNNGSTDVLYTGFLGDGDKTKFSDYYMENASFLRMDNVFVGYNIGKVLRDKANLRLNANVQNVFTVTKYKGLDPEIPSGIDNNFYPRPRIYGIGLNLDF
jgi:iron complex outermembrane receptor protein